MVDSNEPLILPIPAEMQEKRGWTVKINGEIVEHVEILELFSRYGSITYGLTAGGYDSIVWEEPKRNAIVLPYRFIGGVLHVGAVDQDRPNAGGIVQNVPRGFAELVETAEEAALRELAEEVGHRGRALTFLDGEDLNFNNAFVDTRRDGIAIFAYQLGADEVLGDEHGYRVLSTSPKEAWQEKIGACRLLPWNEAAGLGDMFTLSATVRLMAHLKLANA